jgi:hypothetical protein
MRKQANVFSTNYDLFPENAFEEIRTGITFNDGFSRSPLLYRSFRFSMSEFFNSIYNNGNSYNYRVQVPCLNLIKLHGSLSWERLGDEITFPSAGWKISSLNIERYQRRILRLDVKRSIASSRSCSQGKRNLRTLYWITLTMRY